MVSTLEKIRILGENGKFDICASTASSRSTVTPDLYKNETSNNYIGETWSAGICHSYAPDGRCVSLFKVLFTNKCIYNCKYCFTNVCKKRVSFTPEEYAQVFMKLYTMNVLEGLFISSGVCGDADETTKDMLETVRLIRFKYHFQGYIHFKCLPGTSHYLLKEAVALSDRISVNIEAPTKARLNEISPQKNYDTDILQRQKWLKSIRQTHNAEVKKIFRDHREDYAPVESKKKSPTGNEWVDELEVVRKSTGYEKIRWDGAPIMNAGQTTQMVLGASDESDYEVLKRLDWEYREIDLRRGYFSAFSPIEGTPLERHQATPLEREHRLYQTDWLMRLYDVHLKEFKDILTTQENLPKGDPKVHLARIYFNEIGPVDPNHASRKNLLRVPGIGPTAVNRIIELQRNNEMITSRCQLRSIGVILKRADPFLKINGYSQHTLDTFA
ncbi:MAG: putative DNA modification/repair radical SAM protein, partial [Promethearchaeota archaeon]